jgi:hypothetical protein
VLNQVRETRKGRTGGLVQSFRFITIVAFSSVILLVNAHFGLQIAIYQIFKPALIEQYCVNKLKPESNCEGACHMSEIAQNNAAENNSALPENTAEIKFKFLEFCFQLKDYTHPDSMDLPIPTKGFPEISLSNQFLSEIPEAPPRV